MERWRRAVDKLFGIPIDLLLTILLAVFGAGAALLAFSAVRNRVAFKMAARNILRRRAQTALIVLGLMLATLLFSASFVTGDTLANSFRTMATASLGEVDVQVKSDAPSENAMQMGNVPSSRDAYFDAGLADEARDRLADDGEVAGVAPLAAESASVVSSKTGLSEARTDILGVDGQSMNAFDHPTTTAGKMLSVDDLAPNEAYISAELAKNLDVGTGDMVEAYLGERPVGLEVAGVYEKGATPAGETSLLLPLGELQQVTGNEGRINNIIISHAGPGVEGGAHTDATVSAIKPLLADNDLKAEPVKKDAIEMADDSGSLFATTFLMLGQFSIAAGILLIFLIFVMLAAERKRELGIARGVGMQRGHLVRMFAYEGALYALIASAVGSVLGVGVGWAMVKVIAAAIGTFDDLGGEFNIAFAFEPKSVAMAFMMGMVLTFLIVLVASWRVSRLNIIRAIRDIPEPESKRGSVKGWIVAVATPIVGALMFWQGFRIENMALFMLGSSLGIVGLALVARRLWVPDRVAFTVAGAGLLVWWLLPASFFDGILPDGMSQGMEMFFTSGIIIVIGAVWVIIYNADLLLAGIVAVFGRIKGLPPVLKTAVKYPMQSRVRTGMTLAMFSLVVFTIVVMGFITEGMEGTWEDPNRFSGGFEVRAIVGYANPITDMNTALEDAKGANPEDFSAVGSISMLPFSAKQDGASGKPANITLQGADTGYTENVHYGFDMTAEGYDSSREVWQTLREAPNTAVVSASLVASKTSSQDGEAAAPFQLEGFYKEDRTIPEGTYVYVEDPQTGESEKLRVIGVLEQTATDITAVATSKATLEELAGAPVPPQTYMFRLEDGVGAADAARTLEKAFAASGLQASVVAEEVRSGAEFSIIMFNLFTGFMGLGLLVGIAALGVIAARSVVERRQQIGMMRALGFQRGQVRLAFLMESSFVALLGIGTGIALGFGLSGNIIELMVGDMAGVTYQVPWTMIGLVAAIAYAASLLTTFVPARQASKVYPAEALRYE
jgi:putative ABC transport system permease protein